MPSTPSSAATARIWYSCPPDPTRQRKQPRRRQWRTDLETRIRSRELSAALEGHVAKYEKLVPALALINHIADEGRYAVSRASLAKALAFARYAESHAVRVYSSGSEFEVSAAKAISRHIRRGDLKDGFTARDILR